MHPQIDSRRIAPAMTTDEEFVATTSQQRQQYQQQSALVDIGMDPHQQQQQQQQEQQLVIQTRDLTLLTPSPPSVNSRAGMPLGSSPCLVPFAVERGGDVTPHHYLEQGEPASIMADVPAVLDAQPPVSPTTGNQGVVAAIAASSKEGLEMFHEMQVAVDQTTATTDDVGLRRPSVSRSTSTKEASDSCCYYSWSLGDEQVPPPDCQAASSVVVTTTPRNLPTPPPPLSRWSRGLSSLDGMPNEILTHILSFLDVCDLLATSRTNHHFRALSVHPLLHVHRLRRARAVLPPLLTSPSRPTLPELIARHIFQTHTTQVSRRLARSLAAIRLSRRLPQRPSAESLAQRGVLPLECVVGISCSFSSSAGGGNGRSSATMGTGGGGTGRSAGSGSGSGSNELMMRGGMGMEMGIGIGMGMGMGGRHGGMGSGGMKAMGVGVVPLSPALVARKRAVERERLKDGLRRWVGAVWRGEVRERSEGIRRREESAGVGRVWRLRRFWERVGREEAT